MAKLIEELKECWVEDKKEVLWTFGQAAAGAGFLYLASVLLFSL